MLHRTTFVKMSQQASNAVANLLARVGRYAVLLGVGGSAVQASLYTGKTADDICVHYHNMSLVDNSRWMCLCSKSGGVCMQSTEVNEQSCMTEYRECCRWP